MQLKSDLGKFTTFRVISALMLREMITSYGRNPGGYIWAVLEPVGGIVLLTIVFSFFVHLPPLGTSFSLFYFTGLMPFMLYMDVSGKVATSIRFSQPLLNYPRVTYFDAALARLLLNVMTQLLVFCILLCAIVWIEDIDLTLDLPLAGLSFLMASALAFGVGMLNAFLFSIFPIWERIWAIGNRPIFLVSGIFYLIDGLPSTAQSILWWNPLIHVLSIMRAAFYPSYNPAFVSPGFVFGLSLILCVAGVFFLRRYHRKILNELF
ncbi:ABC transporter permease [uncultured Celeribacter sp.]|uniref:ABC transporter permease n=1 Tax=uncultured Celeribacter sp. TaxID=1303376 RepID=UPI002AA6CBAA|nr:ABC transporter permease [uncultured Celeribacter sp.]